MGRKARAEIVNWIIWRGKLWQVEAKMNNGENQTIAELQKKTLLYSIGKYAAKAFNQSILHNCFSTYKWPPSVWTITCVWWNGACVCSNQCRHPTGANFFNCSFVRVKLWWIAWNWPKFSPATILHYTLSTFSASLQYHPIKRAHPNTLERDQPSCSCVRCP